MAAGAMVALTALVPSGSARDGRFFSSDPQVVAVGAEYLQHRLVDLRPRPGSIFVGSSMFQAMGNTLARADRLRSAGSCLVAMPAFLLSRMPGFALHWIWYLSVTALIVQLAVNQLLLFREFGRRLTFAPAAVA